MACSPARRPRNAAAIGAQVRVKLGERTLTRQVEDLNASRVDQLYGLEPVYEPAEAAPGAETPEPATETPGEEPTETPSEATP